MNKKIPAVGTKVYYDVYPEGRNIKGVVVIAQDLNSAQNRKIKQIKAIGKHARQFEKDGISKYVNFNSVESWRIRK